MTPKILALLLLLLTSCASARKCGIWNLLDGKAMSMCRTEVAADKVCATNGGVKEIPNSLNITCNSGDKFEHHRDHASGDEAFIWEGSIMHSGLRKYTKEIRECIEDQLTTYGDLCAESSSGYEEMSGSDAHFDGVKCAAEGIKICLGSRE